MPSITRFPAALLALFALLAFTGVACDDENNDSDVPTLTATIPTSTRTETSTPAETATPSDTATETTTATEAPTETTTPTETATETAPPTQTGPVEDVDVLGIWGDTELESFEAMYQPWQDQNDASVNFTGTRDITSQLVQRVEGNNPPDIALPAEIGLFQQFAREGRLTPLSACPGLEEQVKAEYPQAFLDLGTVDGTLYGFFMKADTKATIWYDPAFFEQNGYQPLTADSTLDDLVTLTQQIAADRDSGKHDVAPWSMGMEAGAGSGFPGTDFIQQILLAEAGPDTYDGIIDGTVPFTDQAMKDAWDRFGQFALTDNWVTQGDGAAINATNFTDAVYPPFEDDPKAAMVYLGGFASGFISAQFEDAMPGTDFNFVPFPGGDVTGSANIAYAFNNDPGTCSFMSYLASAGAQKIWVERGGFTSLNTGVATDTYPDEIAAAQADQLLNAQTFRFDLDDAIGGALQQAFFTGIQDYLNDPSQLDRILSDIESARGS